MVPVSGSWKKVPAVPVSSSGSVPGLKGLPIWTCPSFLSFLVLSCPFLSFLGLPRFFRDFPDLLGDGAGIFPIRPCSLSRPIGSTYEEQSPKGSATGSGPFPKKVGNPPVWKPPGLAFSQWATLKRAKDVGSKVV